MKIGMRNIKTALSVFLCVAIYRLLNLDSPFYAAIAAIIALQSSVRDSFKVGKDRMLGTFLGALTGLLFALIEPGNPFLIGLGIMIVIYTSNLLGWNKSISISGVVFIAIMVNMHGKSPVEYSLHRLLDTFVGISLSVLINYLIVPPRTTSRTVLNYRAIIDKNKFLVASLLQGDELDYNGLIKEVDSLSGNIEHDFLEVRHKKSHSEVFTHAKQVIELSDRIHKHLGIILAMKSKGILNPENLQKLQALCEAAENKEDYVDNEINIVYNYHARNILRDLEELNKLMKPLEQSDII